MRELPEQLERYRAAIEATELPILTADVMDRPPPVPTASQLGGLPWWPADRKWPTDVDGNPLFLLVQINFADAPGLDPFPAKGLLQIFIGSDDLYGCDFDNGDSTGFACVYHADTSTEPLRDFSFLEFGDDHITPLENPERSRELRFSSARMAVDISDYRFERLLPDIAGDDDLSEAFAESVGQAPAIRLGGYPTFTQQDPHSYSAGSTIGDFTLLTVDTTTGIMWGDVGAAQFLMNEADLRRLDFSKVRYNWDCC